MNEDLPSRPSSAATSGLAARPFGAGCQLAQLPRGALGGLDEELELGGGGVRGGGDGDERRLAILRRR